MEPQITEASCTSSAVSKTFFSIPPPTLKRSSSCKLLYQYELVHLPQNTNSEPVRGTDIDIYKTLAKPTPKPKPSFFRSLKTCFNPPKTPQAFFQFFKLEEHPLRSGEQEKFFTLNICKQLPRGSCYDYVHVGAIRLMLVFHSKRALPMATRIAVLDSRYSDYHYACLGMVETTLNSGTVILTLFPNCTLSMENGYWPRTFLVQIQIVGATMDPGLVEATLYSHTACRFQHNALGLGVDSSDDFPLIQIDSGNAPTTIHIPTSITRPELVSILPEAWVSNYEKRQAEQEARRNPFRNRVLRFV